MLLPEDRAQEVRGLMECVRQGQRVEHWETMRLRKDGKRLTVAISISPIRNVRGRIVGASTIARDITARRELETEVLEISERERQRMGRNLHDGLGQHLAGMELLCRTLARSLARRQLPESQTASLLVTQIQEAIVQTRALARGLAPVIASPDGLMLALEEFTTATRALFRMDCRFCCEEPVLISELSAAIHLYRIVQESVTNAIRHGKARCVEVSLTREGRNLVLEVCDNGAGLPPKPRAANGMGFRIMQYRASVMGGTIRFRNASPVGVAVVCKVPFKSLHGSHQP